MGDLRFPAMRSPRVAKGRSRRKLGRLWRLGCKGLEIHGGAWEYLAGDCELVELCFGRPEEEERLARAKNEGKWQMAGRRIRTRNVASEDGR